LARQAAAEKRQRRERGSINADEIINGAFELAQKVSIDNLSMPLLAKHLDVGVTSIYWYFRKKDDLLNAMTDRAFSKYDTSTPFIDPENWRESLQNHARQLRETFRKDPVLCDLVLIRGTLGEQATRTGIEKMEQAIAALVQAGLSPEHAFDTYAAVSVHTRGSIVLERLQDKDKLSGYVPHEGGVIDPTTMPRIAERTRKGHHIGGADAFNFEYGLNCILDHASSLIDKGKPSAAEPQERTARA
jgi:AcrR family transcriptional regulator